MKILCNWQPNKDLPEEIGRSYANIEIRVNNSIITRHTDTRNEEPLKTFDSINVPAYPLAYWFAENWWRIFYDVNTSHDNWEATHNLMYAADGYLWPDLCLVSDDLYISFQSSNEGRKEKRSIQYFPELISTHYKTPIESIEENIISFIELTINQLGNINSDLNAIWKTVLDERKNEQYSIYRKIEARLGYSPDEATESLVDHYIDSIQKYGINAVMDLATENLLPEIEKCNFSQKLKFKYRPIKLSHANKEEAWSLGYSAARNFRKDLNLSPCDVIDNTKLGDAFSLTQKMLKQHWDNDNKINIGLLKRHNKSDDLSLYIGGAMHSDSKRFMTSRLLGAQIMDQSQENLLICNELNTRSQQIQRAFAAEFLCPQQGIKETGYIKNMHAPRTEELNKVAENFGVSPRVVKHQCENALTYCA